MGDLARELGFTKSAIYHHVPSKQHLLTEALDEALDELTAIVTTATEETEDRRRTTGCVRSSRAASACWSRTSRR